MTATLVAAPGLFYPFAVGLVAVVNPCGFPLLPAYLGLAVDEVSGEPGAVGRRAERAMVAGLCATLGFLVVFGAIGLIVELGLSAFYGHAAIVARWVMAAVGLAMLAAGIASLCRRSIRLRLPEMRSGRGLRRPVALFVFGISYAVASLGCAWPLFVGGVAATFTHTSFFEGVGAFAAYALGMGTFLAALALVMAFFGPLAARRLRIVSRIVPVFGSIVLAAVGAYLTLYWVTAIANPSGSSSPLRLVQRFQQWISGEVVGHELALGAALGVLVAGTLIVLGLTGARPRHVGHTVNVPASVGESCAHDDGSDSRTTAALP